MKLLRARFLPRGGIHPADHKAATAALPIEPLPLSKTYRIALNQHLGAPSRGVVKKGDPVLRGQVIAEPAGYVSARVHAPTSGIVKSIETRPTANGQLGAVVEIEADGQDTPLAPTPPTSDWRALPARDLVDLVLQAGVVGMGGAGFPTQVKLLPPPGKAIRALILNGAECEPYLTSDHRLMVEQPERIAEGIGILRHILGVAQVSVVIEDNKPDAIRAMERALGALEGDVALMVVKTRYPQGAEKQLIYSTTRREVPSGGLPMDVGALVENVATAAAIADAVVRRQPLHDRVVTVTGPGVRHPRNLLARVGTPWSELIAACGGLTDDAAKVINGGPMMGIAQSSLDVGMNKTTSGVLLLRRGDVHQFSSMPCIGCGRCVQACPSGLLPCELGETVESGLFEAAETLHVLDCIECGACAYECPARRPLVQHMRQGKAAVIQLRKRREARARQKEPAS
jgi:electron transport complex protein RnfC